MECDGEFCTKTQLPIHEAKGIVCEGTFERRRFDVACGSGPAFRDNWNHGGPGTHSAWAVALQLLQELENKARMNLA